MVVTLSLSAGRTLFNGLRSQKPIVSKDQIQHEEPIEFNNAFGSIGFQGRGNLKAFVNPIWKFTVHAGSWLLVSTCTRKWPRTDRRVDQSRPGMEPRATLIVAGHTGTRESHTGDSWFHATCLDTPGILMTE
uniref:Uncharacterized protein n=1 Tax=Vespula pensylvanica TaxID=30213 RepID=A0A834N6L2_VESPE|nr:hypothetical protein H0235_016426 [Vespula pensylvanica]